jgi:spermidine/putrescine transport system permease protein
MAIAAFTGAPPTQDREPAVRRKSGIALVLLLPGVLYLVLFFLTPLISLIITSFQTPVVDGDIGQYQAAFQWSNYTDSIAEYWPQIIRSFAYALIATAAALLIGYPLAYFIGVTMRGRPVLQNLLMTLVIAPFFISFLLRTLAWKAILSDDAWIASSLKALSILPPDAHITGTPFSVIFGLTYNFIPFMCLPLYATLERLDTRLLEAGQDLYASPWTTFRKVTVPLSLPGIVSGTLLTFIPAAGDYINASQDFLGAADTSMVGNVIESNFLVLQNYPTAAAMSVVLMAVILVIVGVYVRRSGTEELL